MSMTAYERIVTTLSASGARVTGNGAGQRMAQCPVPAHEDRTPSLSITKRDDRVLVKCQAGCHVDDVLAALGFTRADLFDEPRQNGNGRREVATYDYTDEAGKLLFQVVRFEPKDFRQRRPVGAGWDWKLGDTRRVLYQLPAVLKAAESGETVYVVEGEKDVHTVEKTGAVATTNPMGAGKWRDDYTTALTGANVVVVADADPTGRDHGRRVLKSLHAAGVTARLVEPADGKDVTDHLAAGKTLDQLVDAEGEPDDGPADAPPFRQGQLLKRSQLGDLPRVQPLVDGVLSYPAAVVLVGGYSAGKTTLALGLAACVATGQDWLGHKVTRRRVLVVIGEAPYGLEERMAAFEYAWRRSEPVPDTDLEFLIKPSTLAKHTSWLEITAYALEGGFGFVILDTFSSLAPDADETKDAPQIMRWLSDLASAIKGTAVLVHHPGWSDPTRVRGAYAFEANADEVLVLTGTADTEIVSLTRKKVKDGPGGATLWLRRRPILNSVVMEHAGADQLDAPVRVRILTVLAGMADIGATGPQLIAEIGIEDKGRSAFYKALRKAEDEDLVVGIGTRGGKRFYLTEHAPEART